MPKKQKAKQKHKKTNKNALARTTEWLTDNEISEEDLLLAGLGVAAQSVRAGKRKTFKKAHKVGRRIAKAGTILDALRPGVTAAPAPSPSEPVISYEHSGGGWYSVQVSGVEVDRIQGEQSAAERAGILLAAYASQDAGSQDVGKTGISHVGGGWYEVKVAGVPVDRIRGRDAVEERYGELVS